jgi:hypothetical protein
MDRHTAVGSGQKHSDGDSAEERSDVGLHIM